MSRQNDFDNAARRAVASLHRAIVSSATQHGGIYNQGVSFSFENILETAAAYKAAKTK